MRVCWLSEVGVTDEVAEEDGGLVDDQVSHLYSHCLDNLPA